MATVRVLPESSLPVNVSGYWPGTAAAVLYLNVTVVSVVVIKLILS